MSAFTDVVSLGSYCATKFQLSRHAYLQRNPQASVQEVRVALFSSAGIGETHIFDWQVTPFSAVINYIERDFRGLFDRSDLEIDPKFGVARNRLLGVLHSHAFHASGEKLTDADIDAQYEEARSKIDYLAQKFRRLLERTGPILYVASVIPSADEVRRFIRAMEVWAPGQRYHVAFVGRPVWTRNTTSPSSGRWSAASSSRCRASRPTPNGKATTRRGRRPSESPCRPASRSARLGPLEAIS
jgi:hypothetical protein